MTKSTANRGAAASRRARREAKVQLRLKSRKIKKGAGTEICEESLVKGREIGESKKNGL